MNIAYISVVNPQDNDVIGQNLLYYYNLGIRNFYIMFHKPDKILRDIVFVFERDFDIKAKWFINNKEEHYHDRDCKVLTDQAIDDEMDWIVGTDADELLVLKKHKTIQEFLSEYVFDKGSLHFKWYDYKPVEDIYNNAFASILNRESESNPQHKAIGKFDYKMSYVSGLHYIEKSPQVIDISPETAFYAHFPSRNKKQFCDKMTLQAKNWHQRYGKYSHWAEKMIEEDVMGLEKLWNNSVELNKNKELLLDPINPEMFRI